MDEAAADVEDKRGRGEVAADCACAPEEEEDALLKERG